MNNSLANSTSLQPEYFIGNRRANPIAHNVGNKILTGSALMQISEMWVLEDYIESYIDLYYWL